MIYVKFQKFENQKALETEAMLGSRPATIQQKRKGLAPMGGIQAKTRRCDLTDRTITLKVRHDCDGNTRRIEHGISRTISSSNIG